MHAVHMYATPSTYGIACVHALRVGVDTYLPGVDTYLPNLYLIAFKTSFEIFMLYKFNLFNCVSSST